MSLVEHQEAQGPISLHDYAVSLGYQEVGSGNPRPKVFFRNNQEFRLNPLSAGGGLPDFVPIVRPSKTSLENL